MRTKLFFAALLASVSAVSHAAVYRCVGAEGTPLYQQSPCAADAQPLILTPLNTLGDGLRPGERRWLKTLKEPRKKTIESRRPSSFGSDKRKQVKQCLQKRQQYDTIGAKLRRGYKPSQGDALRRRRDNYAEYLRRFCD